MDQHRAPGAPAAPGAADTAGYKSGFSGRARMLSAMWAEPPGHGALVSAAEALDVEGVCAALETEGFRWAWFRYHSVRAAATGAARAATRVGDRASTRLTPEAEAALRQIVVALQVFGDWTDVEGPVLCALERGNIRDFKMPAGAPWSWAEFFGGCCAALGAPRCGAL